MGLKELLFGGYQDTVNDVVGNSYRNEYFERYSPPYICKMCGKTFSEATISMLTVKYSGEALIREIKRMFQK